ncbi:MAG: hypothetical protein D6678_02485 [Zetaproteobacteria bacterium]|nr:MAG: hypothetical protein D6678_02485 [Zetaproteobacteria bacterium]
MAFLANLFLFAIVAGLCLRAYQRRQAWLVAVAGLLFKVGRDRSLVAQCLLLGPVVVGWLLACHWLNTHGWHGPAAGGIALAMTVGMQLMRDWEERQKGLRERSLQGTSSRQG